MSGIGGAGILIFILLYGIALLFFIAVIRYALDSSKTSRKLDVLIEEIRLLRKEISERPRFIDKQG
jgi:hypothetical protein